MFVVDRCFSISIEEVCYYDNYSKRFMINKLFGMI